MKIGVKKVLESAVIPDFAHPTDSGFDLYVAESKAIGVGQKTIVRTGLIFELPEGWGIQVRNKSGMTVKGVPVMVNKPYVEYKEDEVVVVDSWEEIRADITVYLGTIDQAFRGEVGIMVRNDSPHEVIIPVGVKLAQGVLERVYQCEFVEVDEVKETDRGSNGYGSTGTKKA